MDRKITLKCRHCLATEQANPDLPVFKEGHAYLLLCCAECGGETWHVNKERKRELIKEILD